MLIIPGYIEGFRSLKDGTYKINLETNELTPEQLVSLGENRGQFGFVAFKREAFTGKEKELIQDLEADFEVKGKTPGQRLRAVLYKYWEQKPDGFDTFARYYEHKMEQLINHFKDKLDG